MWLHIQQQQGETPMFRKTLIALATVATVSALALAPAAAKGGKGGGGGWGHHGHGFGWGFGSIVVLESACYTWYRGARVYVCN
jgi:hypothetical protein